MISTLSSSVNSLHWGNHTITPVPVKQSWSTWINWSPESNKNLHFMVCTNGCVLQLGKQPHKVRYSACLLETFSALLAFCAGNSPVTGELHTQRPVARSFDVFFDVHLNQQMSKKWRRQWFETPSCSLWRHCNVCMLYSRLYSTCSCLPEIRWSDSLNSYGVFHPSGPKFRRSCTKPWKKQRLNRSFWNACGEERNCCIFVIVAIKERMLFFKRLCSF